MQVIANWADVQGRLVGTSANPTLRDFETVHVAVEKASAVAGFANLLEHASGQTIALNIPAAVARRLHLCPGATLTARIRKGGPDGYFAHPDLITVS